MRIGIPFADHRGDLVGPADVAGVDTDRGDAGVDRLESERRVEMDVGDQRDRAQVDELLERVSVLALRDRDAHDLAAGRGEIGDLGHRRVDVVGLRQGHRLHHDRRTAPDCDAPDPNLAFARHRRKSNGLCRPSSRP
jgi:hypothetical protein